MSGHVGLVHVDGSYVQDSESIYKDILVVPVRRAISLLSSASDMDMVVDEIVELFASKQVCLFGGDGPGLM